MTTAFLTYSEFTDMFEPSQDFSGYEDDGGIDIIWKTVECKNPARENGGWCAFLWKPASEVYAGKWIRQEYNGSSPFAMWWCQQTNDEKNDNPFSEEGATIPVGKTNVPTGYICDCRGTSPRQLKNHARYGCSSS
jgi:hypothetical protein